MKSWEFLKFWKSEAWDKLSAKLYETEFLPHRLDVYKALDLTPFNEVKVVILGQDPYHTKGMAHGLAFSVLPHIKRIPPSLKNIFREYQSDLGYPHPRNGDLRTWAQRGVLLLNTIFTVEEGRPLSHAGIGWEKLTYEIIRSLSAKKVVFLLMGKQAQEYTAACGNAPVVAVPHPSPLSKGFTGSRPFSRVNEELVKLGVEPVDWRLA